jgi:hypothetical protein
MNPVILPEWGSGGDGLADAGFDRRSVSFVNMAEEGVKREHCGRGVILDAEDAERLC